MRSIEEEGIPVRQEPQDLEDVGLRPRVAHESPPLRSPAFSREAAHEAGRLRQPPELDPGPLVVTVAERRRPVQRLPRRHVGADAALGLHLRARADREVSRDADLASEDDAVLEDGRARDPDLRADDVVAADRHVVADLDEVVDLRPCSDRRRLEGRAVHARVRADLDVVSDRDGADLGDLHEPARRRRVAEAVGAEDRAAVDLDALAETDAVVEDDVGMQPRAALRRGIPRRRPRGTRRSRPPRCAASPGRSRHTGRPRPRDRRSAAGSTTAVGWIPGRGDPTRVEEEQDRDERPLRVGDLEDRPAGQVRRRAREERARRRRGGPLAAPSRRTTKERDSGPAPSSARTPLSRRFPSPTTRPPQAAATSATVNEATPRVTSWALRRPAWRRPARPARPWPWPAWRPASARRSAS